MNIFQKITLIGFVCCVSLCSFAQKNLNTYKYIIIPSQFEFLKGKDQFQINSLTKFLFNKNGFKALLEDDKLPDDLFRNRCMAAYADVIKVKGGFLRTRLQIEIKDCYGSIIFISGLGSTKEKDFKKAYNIAVREAFESVAALGYTYQPVTMQKEQPSKVENTKLKSSIVKVTEPLATEIVKSAETTTVDISADATPLAETKEVLYAQAINGGYQLVNAEPRIVMVLLNTETKEVFKVKDKEATVFKMDNKWIYSEKDGEQKIQSVLNIKF